MKRILLLLLPTLLLSGCGGNKPSSSSISSSSTPSSSSKQGDINIVTEQEAIDALNFKNLSNFAYEFDFNVATDEIIHEKSERTFIQKSFKDVNSAYRFTVNDKQYITSKEKYREYCISKSIEYTDELFNNYIQSFIDDEFSVNIEKGIYTISATSTEELYSRMAADHFAEEAYRRSSEDDFEQEFCCIGEYTILSSYVEIFNTKYIEFSKFTYDSQTHYYTINDKSLGGFIYPEIMDAYNFDSYQVNSAKILFENKILKSIDININGKYQECDRSLSLSFEVTDINEVSYTFPEVVPVTCKHGDIYCTQDDYFHYDICEDCDNAIVGTYGACQFDEHTGECSICEYEKMEHIDLLTYDYFGYPVDLVSCRRNAITKKAHGGSSSIPDSRTETFEYILLPDSTEYCFCLDGQRGAPLWRKTGSVTILWNTDSPYFGILPKTYTFEQREVESEMHNVMIISELYCEPIN